MKKYTTERNEAGRNVWWRRKGEVKRKGGWGMWVVRKKKERKKKEKRSVYMGGGEKKKKKRDIQTDRERRKMGNEGILGVVKKKIIMIY